jgi:hypothetical protein
VGVSELTLNHNEWDALVRHLDRMSVPQLMRRKPTPDTRGAGGVMQLFSRGRRLPPPTGGRTVNHAQQRPDRKLLTTLEPRVKLLPGPTIHTDFASLSALPTPDKHRAAGSVEVGLLQ